METNIEFLNRHHENFSINTSQVRLSRDGGCWVNCKDIDLTEDDINNIYHRRDFRPIPDKEFEIGDWVVTSYQPNKPRLLTEDNICYYNGKNFYAQETKANIWYPKEGEWVIYNDSIDEIKFEVLRVKEFNKNTNKVYFGGDSCDLYVYLHEVQPFLGTLPVKDIK